MENKVTAEELKVIKEQQIELNKIVADIGIIEAQKHSLLHKLAEVNEKQEKTKKDLESKYGQVTINLETGEFEVLEKEE
jgi:hypothetical protein